MTHEEIFIEIVKSLGVNKDCQSIDIGRCYVWDITLQFSRDEDINNFYKNITEVSLDCSCLSQLNISTKSYHLHNSLSNLSDIFGLITKYNGIIVNTTSYISKKYSESIVVGIDSGDGEFAIATELNRPTIIIH